MASGWEQLDYALRHGLNRIYLWGPPGLGKTFAARMALNERGAKHRVYDLTVSDDITVQELCGMWVPKGTRFDFHEGPVLDALKAGQLVVNELARASGAVLDFFLAVLDHPSYVTLPTREIVNGHDDFTAIATSNSPISDLTEALADRFDADIFVNGPAPGFIDHLNEQLPTLGRLVARSWNEGRSPVSPRRALAFAKAVTEGGNEEKMAKIIFGSLGSMFLEQLQVERVV